MFGRYSKFVIAVVGALLAWWDLVIDGPAKITAGEWRIGAILLAAALGVYAVPNRG